MAPFGASIDYGARREKIVAALARRRIDLIALSPGDNLRYLLGYTPHPDERPCYLVLTVSGEGLFLVPALNESQARAHSDLPVLSYADADGPAAALAELARRTGLAKANRVAVDDAMRADFLLLLQRQAASAEFVPAGPDLVNPLRMRKEPAERERLRAAAALADQAVLAAVAALRPGVTERKVAAAVADSFATAGAEQTLFALVAAGPNGAFPHHDTSGRAIGAGEPVVLDLGCRLEGYASDITRMAVIGEPPADYRAVHETVERAVQAALAEARPGRRARDVDAAARRVIEAAGYGEYFTHRTGHGIGLTGHEAPWITGTSDSVLEEGMAFSIEPGIYLPGRFGVRLEEIVIIEGDGCRVLSRLPRDLIRVEA